MKRVVILNRKYNIVLHLKEKREIEAQNINLTLSILNIS